MPEGVVVTGMGIVSPIGCGEAAFWDGLCTGRSGAGQVSGLDTADLTRSVACEVRDSLDADRTIGRASQLAVVAGRQSVADAGLDISSSDIASHRLGIVLGTTMGETDFIENRLSADAHDWLNAEHVQQIATGRPGCIARNVQRDLGGIGWAYDLYGACAAGNMALATAYRNVASGHCDVMLAGGADGFSRLAFIGFMRLRVMANGTCRPFDEKRDGLLVGEGACVFVIESESHARARGATIRARILGTGVTSEDYHPTRPSPEGGGLARASRAAIAQANLTSDDVDYVCAHGTGTPQNDAIEVKVMTECFPKGVPFSSIKALTGHTMGATAALEAACCVLSIEHQTLVPTWNLDSPIAEAPLDALRGAPRQASVRNVLNNSAGFGGYNSSILLSAA